MIDTTAIQERLAVLYARDGRLTPEQVVRDAKSLTSPLHDYFQWDDTKAALAWRTQQARVLIRSVALRRSIDVTVLPTPVYIRDPNAEPDVQGYVTVESLRKDKAAARAALVYECNRVAGLVERARGLAVALGLGAEVEATLDSIMRLRQLAEVT
jgi:hypothetical protein